MGGDLCRESLAMPTPNDYSRSDFGGKQDPSSYSQDPSEGVTGEFGATIPKDPFYVPEYPENIPAPGDAPLQSSSNRSGDPLDLLAQTEASVRAHAEMNLAYGLTQPIAT